MRICFMSLIFRLGFVLASSLALSASTGVIMRNCRQQKVTRALLSLPALVLVAACSSTEPVSVTSAAEALETLPDLCSDTRVTFTEGQPARAFTEGGREISSPSSSQVTCADGEKPETSLFIYENATEREAANEYACLNFAASNPEKVDIDLSDDEWDTEWMTGETWEGFSFDYSPSEIASALGGSVVPRRELCAPLSSEMVTVAANPIAPDADLEKSLTYLRAVAYLDQTDEELTLALDLFCDILSTIDEEEVLQRFAENREGALFTGDQAEDFVAALNYGGFDCTKDSVIED
jgi:hypothetical protein